MTDQAPEAFIGCDISLISRRGVRYTGKLYSVDADSARICLESTRSHGTEDRPVQMPIPASSQTYPYIVFNCSDITSLEVTSHPSAFASDPAVVSVVHPPSAPPTVSPTAPAAPLPAVPPPPASLHISAAPQQTHSAFPAAHAAPRVVLQQPSTYAAAAASSSASSSSAPTRGPPTAPLAVQKPRSQQRRPDTAAPVAASQQYSQQRPPRQQQQQPQHHQQQQPAHSGRGGRGPRPASAAAAGGPPAALPSAASAADPATLPGTGDHLRKLRLRGEAGESHAAELFAADFDYVSGTKQHELERKSGDAHADGPFGASAAAGIASPAASSAAAAAAASYAKDNFFDDISSDVSNKGQSQPSRHARMAEERRINTEAFGAVGISTGARHYSRRGRWSGPRKPQAH